MSTVLYVDTDGERPGLRERKKYDTRMALSWATIKLAVERGLDNVRVEDIAAEAGVSPRTFNNYFAGKGEAIVERHFERARQIAAELRGRPADEPLWEAITAAVLAKFAVAPGEDGVPGEQWTTGVRLMSSEPALQAEFIRGYARAQEEYAVVIAERTGTDVTRDLYPRLVAGMIGTAMTVAIQQWLRSDPPGPMEPILRDALGQLGAGLPVPNQ